MYDVCGMHRIKRHWSLPKLKKPNTRKIPTPESLTPQEEIDNPGCYCFPDWDDASVEETTPKLDVSPRQIIMLKN